MEQYDKIIIGAGLYGLYSAAYCGQRGQRVLVLECEQAPFRRATYINQARVHQGYHYPRSLSTAMKSAGYFDRFNRDYDFSVNRAYHKIYATSAQYSWTNGEQFMKFCRAAKTDTKAHDQRLHAIQMHVHNNSNKEHQEPLVCRFHPLHVPMEGYQSSELRS